MAFYIRPPRGCLPLASVKCLAWTRLRFLQDVSRCSHNSLMMRDLLQQTSTVTNSDCLIEGSQKDRVSHFLLRMICAEDKEMEEFFISSEVQLFSYRFSCMTHEELMTCLKPLRRFVYEMKCSDGLSQEYEEVNKIVSALTESYDWSTLVSNFIHVEDSQFVRLPFVHVLDLVRRRTVDLDHGTAAVPCSKLCDVMSNVFLIILKRGMTLAKQVLPSVVNNDKRMAALLKAVQTWFHKTCNPFRVHLDCVRRAVRCEDVGRLVENYPPCMHHLHQELQDKHRLDHTARIQYTLFLKEVGLPLHEALQFWRKEYSQVPAHRVAGGHSWKTDGKRYIYSIRHLYGLEGARINYRGRCCQSLQNQILSGSGAGGCPFRHFDQWNLIEKLSLDQLPLDRVRRILILSKQEGCYSEACSLFLKAKLEKSLCSRRRNEERPLRFGSWDETFNCVRSPNEEQLAISQKENPRGVVGVLSKKRKHFCEVCSTDCQMSHYSGPTHAGSTLHKDVPIVNSHRGTKRGSNGVHKSINHITCHPDVIQNDRCPTVSDVNLMPRQHIYPESKQTGSEADVENLTGDRVCLTSQSSGVEGQLSPDVSVIINKPIDFYLSYKTLLESLRQ